MSYITELRQRRAARFAEARAILDAAEKDKRALTAEEQAEYDTRRAEVEALRREIEAREDALKVERELAASTGRQAGGQDEPNEPAGRSGGEAADTPVRSRPEYRAAFTEFLRGRGMHREYRAMQADDDAGGGYLVPDQFAAGLIQAADAAVFIRRLATIETLTQAGSLGAVSLDGDLSDATWTTELATGAEDTGLTFGKRKLEPHSIAKRVKISNTLLRLSSRDVEALVRDRLAYKFGITMEKAYLTGSGAGQPLGVFTASNDGIPTSRDVSTGNTTTAMTFDGLKKAKYSLKAAYWPRAQWAFHTDGVYQLDTIKDSNGQYVLQPDLRAGGTVDRLLGFPVNVSEYVPNTFTTGLYVGILADWSYYWIADALDMTVQVLKELYAETNQTGFIGRMESDGMPVLAEAFVRVKLA